MGTKNTREFPNQKMQISAVYGRTLFAPYVNLKSKHYL